MVHAGHTIFTKEVGVALCNLVEIVFRILRNLGATQANKQSSLVPCDGLTLNCAVQQPLGCAVAK
jgi:hypothetical protein